MRAPAWFPRLGIAILVLSCSASLAPAADDPDFAAATLKLQQEYDRIAYAVAGKKQQLGEIGPLAAQAMEIVTRYPDRAEALIWAGIIIGKKGSLVSVFKALGLAEQARDLFAKAEGIDPRALAGAAPAYLGNLYHRLPGPPIGFGDEEKARHLLEEAVALAPDGIEANYFYGAFLTDAKEYDAAETILRHALALPPNPDRPLWDRTRRAEIEALLARIEEKRGY